ncbi:MAG: succinate dehydrogenase iron-sulfur subunit [Spirochaetia bacterium]|jgi:succinate dehydrogenase / fumarate reductase iron-sulfur subunit
MKIVLRIRRFDPQTDREPHDEDYPVEAEPTERILDALIRVKDEQDGSLCFRRSCGHGVCGSDAMIIAGAERLACKTLVRDVAHEDGALIPVQPLRFLPVQRDLMVDQAVFFQKFKLVKPFLINGEPVKEKERTQSQAERAVFDDVTSCILCGACYSSCPVLEKNTSYVGPAALVQAARFIFDSRDRGLPERMSVLDGPDGASACENHFNCTRVCPRGIKITKNINATKRLLAKVKEGSA